MTDSSQPLRVERTDQGVVTVTLALPDRRNAMTAELTEAWVSAMDALRADQDARCVVVTGEGRAFCAGGDLGWLASSPDLSVDELRDRMLPFYQSWLSIRSLSVPTIAAINGPAVGAGLCLAMACDLRYAAATAKLSAPFTALGIHPGMAATFLLPELVGLARARELLFTGRAVLAEEALSLGLVNGVFSVESLADSVAGIAATIAGQAPIAQRLTKAALARGGHATIEDALAWEALAQPITMGTEDLQEGIGAVRERRPPHFSGR